MKMMKGSLMVEAAYIMPVIFLSFIAGLYMLFYFHEIFFSEQGMKRWLWVVRR